MMNFWAFSWGDVATVVGIVVSLIGLGWAIKEARGAKSASQAARTAAREARNQISQRLQTVDLERAFGLIQRIKLLHDIGRWEAALEQYPPLRIMLSDITARCSVDQESDRDRLNQGIRTVESMENFVRKYINADIGNIEPGALEDINSVLNEIEGTLVAMSSSAVFENLQDET